MAKISFRNSDESEIWLRIAVATLQGGNIVHTELSANGRATVAGSAGGLADEVLEQYRLRQARGEENQTPDKLLRPQRGDIGI